MEYCVCVCVYIYIYIYALNLILSILCNKKEKIALGK